MSLIGLISHFMLTFWIEHVTIVSPYYKKGSVMMSFKDHILFIVKEEHKIEKLMEYQRLNALLTDSITAFKDSLTPAQKVMLDQSILQLYDEIMSLQYEFVCYRTFEEVTKAWRALLLDDYMAYEIKSVLG